jgi:hypothetical protein
MSKQSKTLRQVDEFAAAVLEAAAAELRRLQAENEAFGIHLSERMKDLAKVEAQRDALLEALKELTGHANERFSGGVWDRARAVIKSVEEGT